MKILHEPFRVACVTLIALALVQTSAAHARPGGGQSASGGASSGSSFPGGNAGSRGGTGSEVSSGSGSRSSASTSSYDSTVIPHEHSTVTASVPLATPNGHLKIEILLTVLILIGGYTAYRTKIGGRQPQDWTTARAKQVPAITTSARARLLLLADSDPNFSTILFEDFLYNLYVRVHEARGLGKLEDFAAYLAPAVRQHWGRPSGLVGVTGIVVGALRIEQVRISPDEPLVYVEVMFETNYTETTRDADGKQREATYQVGESWLLARRRDALSRTPDTLRLLSCPNCGAPLQALRGNHCSHCNTVVEGGQFDWMVMNVTREDRAPRAPVVSGYVEEVGNDLPTIVNPWTPDGMRELSERDPSFAWPEFQGRVALIFNEIQSAWSSDQWRHARPFLSDRLFLAQQAWLDSYRQHKLRNITENNRITHIQCACVIHDRFFDALTIRLYVTGLDYTIRTDNRQLVGGSTTAPRKYTEYWTLIRSADRKGPCTTERQCPNCGAPLNVNMAGSCEYCRATVTTGDFDWVLSRIEQDEVYSG